MFRDHSHPLGYLCVKVLLLFTTAIGDLAHGEKLCTHSVTHWITRLVWCHGSRSFCFRTTWL